MTVHKLDVRLVFEQALEIGSRIGAFILTMAGDPKQKSDLTPSPGGHVPEGTSQNFFQDFVCCICGEDATLSHGQTDSLYCVEHNPDNQNQKERTNGKS